MLLHTALPTLPVPQQYSAARVHHAPINHRPRSLLDPASPPPRRVFDCTCQPRSILDPVYPPLRRSSGCTVQPRSTLGPVSPPLRRSFGCIYQPRSILGPVSFTPTHSLGALTAAIRCTSPLPASMSDLPTLMAFPHDGRS